MSDETQFKNARGKMELNNKRDELNPYARTEHDPQAYYWQEGFDAAVEILSTEKVSCARHESHNRECFECVKYAYYETKEKVFNLETERNEAEYKVKELEKALEWIAKGPTWGIGAPSLEEQAHSQAKKAKEALANLSKLRGGKNG